MTTNKEINQPSNQDIQLELSRTRTLTALDRTLLAWIRTSLTLIGFGFTLAKFVHELIASGTIHLADSNYPRQLGITLMVLGIVGLFAGAIDYWRSVKALKATTPASYWSASLIVSLIIAIISILVMCSLLTNLRP